MQPAVVFCRLRPSRLFLRLKLSILLCCTHCWTQIMVFFPDANKVGVKEIKVRHSVLCAAPPNISLQ